MRVTSKYLIKWCNEQFEKFEINDFTVVEVVSTKYSQEQIQNGACRLHIRFTHKTSANHVRHFLSFYSMKELQQYIDGVKWGKYELYLKPDRMGILTNFELDVRKL